MGASNVAKVFAYKEWRDLSHRDARLLLYMANISLDADAPPRFFDRWETLADAIGSLPDRKDFETEEAYVKALSSSRRQIEKALQSLAAAGAIAYSGHARKGVKAEYALSLDPDVGWLCRGMERDKHDGRLKGKWEPFDRASARPKKSVSARPKKSPEPDQKSREVPTKKVGPMSTQEQPQEQGTGSRSPQATNSPAAEARERDRQLQALEALMQTQGENQ